MFFVNLSPIFVLLVSMAILLTSYLFTCSSGFEAIKIKDWPLTAKILFLIATSVVLIHAGVAYGWAAITVYPDAIGIGSFFVLWAVILLGPIVVKKRS